jgi:hypothetical protein
VDRPGCGTLLTGRVLEAFDDDELRAMLSGGVLMDSAALRALTERGLGDLAGVRVARELDNGLMERFSDDPLNGEHAGETRDCRIEFWGDARGLADELEPIAPNVRVLATLRDYFQQPHGVCLTAFENELGGRVVVMGYAPWMFMYSVAKRAQLLNVADWITRGALPVRIEEAVPLTPIVRASEDRSRGVAVMLNWGLDRIEHATLHVRAPEAPAYLGTPKGLTPIARQDEPEGWTVALGPIKPWTTVCVFWGEMRARRSRSQGRG